MELREATLFEEIFTAEDKAKIQGGTLYVTLEPCNQRYFTSGDEAKIPCAVRCVMAGIERIFIGTRDPDESVNWGGATTLDTGSYAFDVNADGVSLYMNSKKGKALSLLMKVFDDRGFSWELKDGKKIYDLQHKVITRFFHPDLALEVMLLNREFLQGKEGRSFTSVNI